MILAGEYERLYDPFSDELKNIVKLEELKPIPKKKIYTTSGNREYAQAGEGVPAVILINGGGGPIEGWYKVFHELAAETTVLAYNRFLRRFVSFSTHSKWNEVKFVEETVKQIEQAYQLRKANQQDFRQLAIRANTFWLPEVDTSHNYLSQR